MLNTGTLIENRAYILLENAIAHEFHSKIALVSSFGTESAVLLHMVAQIDAHLPILFLDTGKIFPDTIAYRDGLINRLRLSNVRTVRPDQKHLNSYDPDGRLYAADPDLCCALRKTMPLDAALEPFDAWISGRKRNQSETRRDILPRETGPNGMTIINPLYDWSKADITRYFAENALPPHPLEASGFTSLGCFSCTSRIRLGDNSRAGRWAGSGKTECGIFLPRLAMADETGDSRAERTEAPNTMRA